MLLYNYNLLLFCQTPVRVFLPGILVMGSKGGLDFADQRLLIGSKDVSHRLSNENSPE